MATAVGSEGFLRWQIFQASNEILLSIKLKQMLRITRSPNPWKIPNTMAAICMMNRQVNTVKNCKYLD